MKNTLFVFDMDGTLINSKDDITTSINHVRAQKGLKPIAVEVVVDAINGTCHNLAEVFYETPTYEHAYKELFEAHYFEQCMNSKAYERIPECLKVLKNAGAKLSVATNAPTKFAKRMLESNNLLEHFDFVIGADKVVNSKPDPEMLNLIITQYEHEFERVFMIGDNYKDMQCAKNAGVSSVFVTWGFGEESEHDYSIACPLELHSIF